MTIPNLTELHQEWPPSTRRAVLGIIIILYLILAIPGILTNSVTFDEFTHIPVGYAQSHFRLFQLEPANPPLIRMIFGYPITNFTPRLYWGSQLANIHYHPYCLYFMENNIELYHLMAVTSRFITLGLSILLAYLVYRWSREEYGSISGFFVLILCLFNPTMIAHGTLATLDTGLALTWVALFYSLKKYLDDPSWTRTMITGIFLGLALTVKYTSLLLYIFVPMLILLDPVMRYKFFRRKVIFQAVLIILISIAIINLIYGFHRSFTPLREFELDSPTLKSLNAINLRNIPIPLPYYYVVGMDQQLSGTGNYNNYMNGQISQRGFWFYYIEAFIIKNPIPFLIFLFWSIAVFIRKRDPLTRSEQIWVLVSLLVIIFFSLSRTKNLGIRYILPTFPFLFMLSGRIINPLLTRNQIVLIFLLIIWFIGSSIYFCPQYLAYYNELIGGPKNGYKYLLDSNTDWGQDHIRLKSYMNKNNINKIWFTHSGPVDPRIYGINYEPIPPEPVSGIVAIGVDQYYGIFARDPSVTPRHNWLKTYQPIDRVGQSIFIYNIP